MDRQVQQVLSFIFSLLFVIACFVMVTEAHCKNVKSTSHVIGGKIQDSQGVLVTEALLIDSFPVEGTEAAVVRIFPVSGMSTTDILVCDYGHFRALTENGRVFTFTFTTMAHHRVMDIGCHELIEAKEMTGK